MDCIVHGVTKSQTRMSDFHSLTLMCVHTCLCVCVCMCVCVCIGGEEKGDIADPH